MKTVQRSGSDSDPFLEMIEARVAALQQLRASYLAAKATGALGQVGDVLASTTSAAAPSLPAPNPDAPPARRTRRRGVASEVERLLIETATPMKVRDIAADLRRSGFASTGGRLDGTINSSLHRLKHRGRAVRTPAGWRASSSTAAPELPTVVRLPPHGPRRPRRLRPTTGEPTPDRRPDGLAWRIESLLKSHGQPVAARFVAEATGEPLNVVGLTLGRMVKQQRVEKQPDGHFAVVVPMADEEPAAADASATTNGVQS